MWIFSDKQMHEAVKQIAKAEQPNTTEKDFKKVVHRNLQILQQHSRQGNDWIERAAKKIALNEGLAGRKEITAIARVIRQESR